MPSGACVARSRRSRLPTRRCCSWARVAPARSSWRGRCTGSPDAPTSHSSASTVPRSRRRCSRASCSAMRREPSPPPLQAKLLRVVQERSVERVGGRVPVALNLRIVCATNRDLQTLMGSGAFREDLFYRLSEVTIRVPPLRERQGDSLLLAQFALQQISERFAKPTRGLAPDAIRAIQAHRWPGNVRELENRIKGAVIMAEGAVVTANDLGLEDPGDDPEYLNLRVARARAEAQAVRQALAVARGNLSRAAELLGVTRPTLYDLLDKHSIDSTPFAKPVARAPAEGAPAEPAAKPADDAGGSA